MKFHTPIDGTPDPEGKAPIIAYIHDRVYNKNNSFVMVFIGQTGSGKSYASLSMANQIDNTFSSTPLHQRVAFKALEFMKNVQTICESPEGSRGKVVTWDEFGVEHNAREFMTLANRLINFFFQTARHKNMIMLMTVPYLSYIDGATRKLCHAFAEMQYINPHTKTSVIKLKFQQVNATSGKEYHKYFRYKSNGHSVVCKRIGLPLPPAHVITQYEKIKASYTTDLRSSIINKLESKDKKDKEETKGKLNDLQKRIHALYDKGMRDKREMAKILGITLTEFNRNLVVMHNKGYLSDF